MLSLIFLIVLVIVFGKFLFFAIRCAWGIMRILFTFLFLPVILIGMFLSGFAVLAIGLAAVIGLVSFLID